MGSGGAGSGNREVGSEAAKVAGRLLGATLLAFGLSAFLSLPALLEKDLVTLEGLLYVSHTDHFPSLQQIMPNSIVHGYGIIFPDSPIYAYKMGLVQVGLGGLGVLLAFGLWKRFGWRARGEAVISLALFGLAFYFSQPPSLWLWNSIPLLPHAQFPWRFLLLMALPTSLMVGYLVDAGGARWRRWATPPLVAFVLLTNVLGLKPIMANAESKEIDLTSSIEFELLYHLMGTTVAGEYIPRTVKDRPFVNPTALAWTLGSSTEPSLSPSASSGQALSKGSGGADGSEPVHPTASDPNLRVDLLRRGATSADYRVSGEAGGRAVFNVVYFPEWRARLDGIPTAAEPNDPQGLISVQVPPGEHTVSLRFENTPLRTWSELFSLACLVATLAVLVWSLIGRKDETRRESVDRRVSLSPRPRVSSLLAAAPFLLTLIALPLGARAFADGYQPRPVAQRSLKIDLGSSIRLLGYDLMLAGRPLARRDTVPPGSQLELAVYWLALDSPQARERSSGPKVYARLTNIDEQQWSQAVETRSETLPDGQTVRSLVLLPVPPAQPPGAYQIEVGLFAGDSKPLAVKNMELVELLPTQGSVRLGPLLVRPGGGETPNLRLAAGTSFENAVRLESFDVSKGVSERRLFSEAAPPGASNASVRAAAGDTLQLDLLWRALRDRPGHYLVSVSLVDDQGFKWAVRDAEPADRMYPTWMWSAGRQVRDQLRMPVPPETPPGRYRLQLRVLQQARPLSIVGPEGAPAGGQAELIEVELARSEVSVRPREIRGVTSRDRVRLNEDLEIVAADYGRTQLRPGESTDVSLIWHALRDVRRDYSVRLKLLGPDGALVGQAAITRPAGALNPTNRWENNNYFRGQFRLSASANARPGSGRLALELLETGSERVLATNDRLADVQLLERAAGAAPSAARYPTSFAFGSAIRLAGFDIEPPIEAGVASSQSLLVTLLWQADGQPDRFYTVFAQLLDSDGRLVAQHDGPPAEGRNPTSGWLPGDSVADEHHIELPRGLPSGEYRLIVGLYDQRGERLSLPNGENFAELARVRVR